MIWARVRVVATVSVKKNSTADEMRRICLVTVSLLYAQRRVGQETTEFPRNYLKENGLVAYRK